MLCLQCGGFRVDLLSADRRAPLASEQDQTLHNRGLCPLQRKRLGGGAIQQLHFQVQGHARVSQGGRGRIEPRGRKPLVPIGRPLVRRIRHFPFIWSR